MRIPFWAAALGSASAGAGGAMGRGFGFGWRGRGWRPWFSGAGFPAWMGARYAVPTAKPDPDLEKRDLRDQAEALQAELEAIKARLSEIESGAETP